MGKGGREGGREKGRGGRGEGMEGGREGRKEGRRDGGKDGGGRREGGGGRNEQVIHTCIIPVTQNIPQLHSSIPGKYPYCRGRWLRLPSLKEVLFQGSPCEGLGSGETCHIPHLL